jgi:hypothetical protein
LFYYPSFHPAFFLMKIASLELFKVPPRWLFLKITADDGLTGWGEPIVEGRADTVAAALTELGHYLLGRNPDQIEDLLLRTSGISNLREACLKLGPQLRKWPEPAHLELAYALAGHLGLQ